MPRPSLAPPTAVCPDCGGTVELRHNLFHDEWVWECHGTTRHAWWVDGTPVMHPGWWTKPQPPR